MHYPKVLERVDTPEQIFHRSFSLGTPDAFETGNTAYFVLWSCRSKTSYEWVVLCWNIPASTQNIINNQWPHILFNGFPTVESSSVQIHYNVSWSIWALQMVTRASPNFHFTHFLLIIIIIIRCSGVFRNVPGCSMFLVLIDGWRCCDILAASVRALSV